MTNLTRGMRDKLEKYLNPTGMLEISMQTQGTSVYDYCCFGVDAADQLSDDRYMVFYNQTSSPANEIRYAMIGNTAKFQVNLSALPRSIRKLVFTVSIDGNGTMGMISRHMLAIGQSGFSPALQLELSGRDFKDEKAIISVEIYYKDAWRVNAVARGFNGGLGDLLRAYGGEEDTSQPVPAPAAPPAPPKISLEKKLQKHAPELVSLAKPITAELEKRNLLDCIAKVGLVLDISGSMHASYENGTVQEIVNKILPLAVQFDDDGELDFWYYGSRCKRMDSVNMKNYKNAVPKDWKKLMKNLGYGNNEPVVMNEVLDEYQHGRIPAYVIFVTDGGVSAAGKIKSILKKASHKPIFWQFVGVSGSGYGILEQLDTMDGRYVDNANFFALDDFRSVSNPDLYGRLLNEFPSWLKEIKQKGMI